MPVKNRKKVCITFADENIQENGMLILINGKLPGREKKEIRRSLKLTKIWFVSDSHKPGRVFFKFSRNNQKTISK